MNNVLRFPTPDQTSVLVTVTALWGVSQTPVTEHEIRRVFPQNAMGCPISKKELRYVLQLLEQYGCIKLEYEIRWWWFLKRTTFKVHALPRGLAEAQRIAPITYRRGEVLKRTQKRV